MLDKVYLRPSSTADTRTCDVSKVSKEQLLESSLSHKEDVLHLFGSISDYLVNKAEMHDCTKITRIDWFFKDFKTGFKTRGWYDMHRQAERHHIAQADGVPIDVNLFDVIEHLVDNVTACVARTGDKSKYQYAQLNEGMLLRAIQNTEDMLLAAVEQKSVE